MIWPNDAARLAYTKLKTRKVRLVVSLVISSLLFSVLLTLSLVVRGVINSVETFSSNGFGNRYIVRGNAFNNLFEGLNDPVLIAKAETMQKDLIEKKKAEAKRLKIDYDSKNEPPYVTLSDGPTGKAKYLDISQPAVMKLLQDSLTAKLGTNADFSATANKYNAKATYKGYSVTGGAKGSIPYLTVLEDGKEKFDEQSVQNTGRNSPYNSLPNGWNAYSSSLIKPFLLKGQNLEKGSDGTIPIIVPISAAREILSLKSLPASATADVRLQRLKYVRQNIAGKTFSVCYRNDTSKSQLDAAVAQQKEITENKTNKDYQKPSLIHGLPASACGVPVVIRDVRTAAEKQNDLNQTTFRQTFGERPPESNIYKFRVVGINSDFADSANAVTIAQIFQGILGSSLGDGWFSPLEMVKDNPQLAEIFSINDASSALSVSEFAEFSSPAAVTKILDEQNCEPDFSNMPQVQQSNSENSFDPYAKCKAEGKYFTVMPFGSSSTAISDLKKGFSKVFKIVALIAAALASLIMMGMVGRIIADSRRETAVFRAIGAKKIDIWQIYLTYTIFVAALIAVSSLVLGSIIAEVISNHYTALFTVIALLSFNVQDLNQKFDLFSFYPKDLLYVVGIILAAAVLAAVLPLLNNVRRNPIRDMRDDR